MTLLAGIFSRGREIPISESICTRLKQAMSRHPEDPITIFRDSRAFLLKVDIGAYGEPAYRIDATGTVTMLVGEPLLHRDEDLGSGGRARDLEVLHQRWDKGDWTLLRQTQGVFCAVHYQPDGATLTLVADKLSLRPLYYWAGKSFVIFASALRILEALPDVPKRMDLRAVTELASFGYPLGDRTPYCDIRALRAAQILQCDETKLSSSKYWRWDTIPVSNRSEEQLLKEVSTRFTTAIARRLRGDTTTVAMLSGGLDSRCVVAALRAQRARVHTFNFSWAGSQDQVFGDEFAQKIGTIHHAVVHREQWPPYKMMADAWAACKDREQWPAERPMLIWTGDGGSVGLGHVYVYPRVISLLRAHKVEEAIEQFLREEKKQVLSRLLHRRIVTSLSEVLHEGVREELRDIHSHDPGRNLYIFLLLNDQWRHLGFHFENIDLHRLEMQMPFYESDFLASVIAIHLDLCLCHRFYTKWLSLFDLAVTSVPWQTYPGHEPCPVPFPTELRSQWDWAEPAASRALAKAELLRESGSVLRSESYPRAILNRPYLRLARWVHSLGFRDYEYVLRAAHTYHRYWTACSGNYVVPN